MEKQRANPGPKPRVKRALLPPGDFIALGKTSGSKVRTDLDPSKGGGPSRKPITNMSSMAQKRKEIISPPINPVAAKMTRTFPPSFVSRSSTSSPKLESETVPNVKVLEVTAVSFEDDILTAKLGDDYDTVEGLLCGAMKQLKVNRMKPDQMLFLALINLAKTEPKLFQRKPVVEYMMSFLRRENTVVKTKPNTMLCILACNILMHAYHSETTWPQSFIKVYTEDAIGDRSWVDNEHNKPFVANITSVFHTNKKVEEDEVTTEIPANRYDNAKDEATIMSYVNDVVRDQLNKRQMIDSVSRNFLRFLSSVCGYADIRLLASQKMETWLQNPKLTRPAQELLMSVCMNCTTNTVNDMEVVANLIRMRLKAKPIFNHYIVCIREMLSQHAENVGTALKNIVYNELSNQRNPNNMNIINTIFTVKPEKAALHLSTVFQDLLCNRDDFLRALRALLREIVRTLKHDINLVEFCRGLMQHRREAIFQDLEQPVKDRMLSSILDLICLGCFLCISPAIKELYLALSKAEDRDYSVMHSFQQKLSLIQRDVIWFFHTNVMPMYRCSEKTFVLGLRHALFMDGIESYCAKDNWPPESDRQVFLQLVQEVPLKEDGLFRLHFLGLSSELQLSASATLDIIDALIMRAAKLKSGLAGVEVERTEVIKMLISLSTYSHPRDITLPQNYTPPSLAISNFYWKAWVTLLVLAATNPATIGASVWHEYPTARFMMEMVITGSYSFPPAMLGENTQSEILSNDMQASKSEKEEIIIFEGHLAAASGNVITESNSLLISQLTSLNPVGLPRRPPQQVIEKLKSLNQKLGLSQLLCKSRSPDFLLSIVQSQDSSKGMPWLADLVQSSECSLESLPLQCLCEFLVMNLQTKQKSIKSKVAARLQDLLFGTEATADSSIELVKYFIHRWSSADLKDRDTAVDGLQSILLLQRRARVSSSADDNTAMDVDDGVKKRASQKMSFIKDDKYNWLHKKIPTLQYFQDLLPYLLTALRKALRVEVCISRLAAYIVFLVKHSVDQPIEFVKLFVQDLSFLFNSRKVIVRNIGEQERSVWQEALKAFHCYFNKSIESNSSQKQKLDEDDILVSWSSKKSMAASTSSIQAVMLLLVQGSPEEDDSYHQSLMRMFFPLQDTVTFSKDGVFTHDLNVFLLKSDYPHIVDQALERMSMNEILNLVGLSSLKTANASNILQRLDSYCVEDADKLFKLIEQKGILEESHSWVEVYLGMGCGSGRTFYDRLDGLKETTPTVGAVVHQVSVRPMVVGSNDIQMTPIKSDPVVFTKDLLTETLQGYFLNKNHQANFIKLKQALALSAIKKQLLPFISDVLETCLELSKNTAFVKSFCKSPQSVSFVKTIGLNCSEKRAEFVAFLQAISSEVSVNTSLKIMHGNLMKNFGDVTMRKEEKKITKVVGDFIRLGSKILLHKAHIQSLFNEIANIDDITVVSKEQWVTAGKVIVASTDGMFEGYLNSLYNKAVNHQSRKLCVEVIVDLLGLVEERFAGLLVNMLQLLDPEGLSVSPQVQRELLFTRFKKGNSVKAKSYLISLLAHQTRNTTLEDCLTWLLDSAYDVNNLNAGQCLNMIEATMENQRLWAGRESKKNADDTLTKKEGYMDIELLLPHLYRLIQIILCEANQTENCSQELREETMQKRIMLLFALSENCMDRLKKAIQLVKRAKKTPVPYIGTFLKLVYLNKPLLLPELATSEMLKKRTDSILKHDKVELDSLVHRLSLSIAGPDGTIAWDEKFKCVSALNRRLAHKHPQLFLRQIALLISLLQGRSRHSTATFRMTNQLALFKHVIELCNMLKPHVFVVNEQMKEAMASLVVLYLQLIQSQCVNREQSAMLLSRLCDFLVEYIASNNPQAGDVLKLHKFTFIDLLYMFPEMPSLSSICTFVKTLDSCNAASLIRTPATRWVDVTHQWKSRLGKDRHNSEICEALQDLENTALRRVDVLEHFIPELTSLLYHESPDIRLQSHVLLLTHCSHKPGSSTQMTQIYMDCLSSQDHDVISSAIMHLPQFVLLIDENCGQLLQKMMEISANGCSIYDKHLIAAVSNLNTDYT